MNRLLLRMAPLALSLLPAWATAADQFPPPEYAAYFAAVRKADAIQDPLERCLAYPDLPGNTWPKGLAKARCRLFLAPPPYPLEAIEAILAQPDGGKALDAKFQALLDAHFNDPSQQERIDFEYRVFRKGDLDKAEQVARAWLAASPDSAYAHTALGQVLEQRGWKARGNKFVKDTPDAQLQEMERLFVEAAGEYGPAMRANPKLMPACIGAMAIGRQLSNLVQAFAIDKCVEADPGSYYVVEELMRAAEPRWGGSEEAMRFVAAYAQARVAEHPMLALFAFDLAAYVVDHADDQDAQAIAVLEPAALQVPNANYMQLVGAAYLRDKDYWKALAFLSQTLRFSPEDSQNLRFRAIALTQLGEPTWARADAEHAVALDPDNGYALELLGDILRKLDGPAAALPYYKRATQISATREHAFNDYCGSLIDARQHEAARQCVDELLAAFPENPEGWRQRLMVIGFEAPGSQEAMERFLALNDPERWSYHAAAAEIVRKLLAAKTGVGTPADLFEGQATRARAQERTAAGRAYYKAILAPGSSVFEKAVDACNAALAPGIPRKLSAVMAVKPDGTITGVMMRPENAWSACFAKVFEAGKLPAPPEGDWGTGYPMLYELKMR